MRKIFTVAVMALATLPVMADEQPETQPKQAENEKAIFELIVLLCKLLYFV